MSDVVPTLDLQKLLTDGEHFSEKRGKLIHIISSLTGQSVAIFPEATPTPQTLEPHTLENGTVVYTPMGAPLVSGGYREITHNPVIIDLICQRISEGESLTDICKDPSMPTYPTLMRWRRKHDYIEKALHEARIDRAEGLRDKALKEADKAESKDPIGAHALRVDTLKWAAGVDSPRFSPKAKVEATIQAPTVIQVVTGIDRGPKDV